jgi:hypothetical protein
VSARLKAGYDDGGLSGATMERPGLQRILADISQGLIDVVVVYKVDRNGIRSKVRVSKDGVESGGQAFSRGALYTLLRNPIYVGEIRHKGVCHPGQQAHCPARFGSKNARAWETLRASVRRRNVAACSPEGVEFELASDFVTRQ